MTADSSGRRLYVDGVKVEDTMGGNLTWAPTGQTFSISGDSNGLNQWIGTFHLVAMYSQAFDDTEVMRNLMAGP